MSFFAEHPRTRWAVPAVAVAVLGATTFVTSRTATADAGLPARSAAQLLADVSQAQLESLSGTVVQTADLGLPQVPGLSGAAGGGNTSLTSVVSGTHTWRVWLAGPTQQRLALVGSLGESDVIRNGKDLWLWSSQEKTAVHHTLPADDQKGTKTPDAATNLPKTPQEAADMALAAISPTTQVTTSGTAVVAGRQAYELVLKPKDTTTRIASVRIAIDSQKHIPLRVQLYSTKIANPAFEVGFTAISFAKPEARQFAFNPPAGTTVTESGALAAPKPGAANHSPARNPAAKPRVVGTGWSSVVVATLPPDAQAAADQQSQLAGILRAIPRASGAWGSGHVVDGTLFSAVVTDDGRVAVGAVAPDQLYAALAAK